VWVADALALALAVVVRAPALFLSPLCSAYLIVASVGFYLTIFLVEHRLFVSLSVFVLLLMLEKKRISY
jgi:hypothetical protein